MTKQRRRCLSDQGWKEKMAIDAWAARLGPAFRHMEKHLENYRLHELVQEAELLATIKQVAHFQRVCRRHKRAAICWLVENDPEQLTRPRLRIDIQPNAQPEFTAASGTSDNSWSDIDLTSDDP
jgi:hypothetical protein